MKCTFESEKYNSWVTDWKNRIQRKKKVHSHKLEQQQQQQNESNDKFTFKKENF